MRLWQGSCVFQCTIRACRGELTTGRLLLVCLSHGQLVVFKLSVVTSLLSSEALTAFCECCRD